MNDSYELVGIAALVTLLGSIIYGIFQMYRLRKKAKLETSKNVLMKDQRGRQLYIHESHILMAGLSSATECINCGGNSTSSVNLKKLFVPCSMELSVYDGNNKFKHITGEPNV